MPRKNYSCFSKGNPEDGWNEFARTQREGLEAHVDRVTVQAPASARPPPRKEVICGIPLYE